MPKLTKRGLQAIETKNRIHETAVKLMELKGFDNITIEEISKKSGVSVGAFYHYFKSKDDILYKLFENADEFMKEKAVSMIQGDTSIDRIVSFFDLFTKLYLLYGIDIIKALYKTQSRLFLCQTSVRFTMLEGIVNMGIEQGEIDSSFAAKETTKFLFTGARGLLLNWCMDNGTFDLPKQMHIYMSRLVRSITP